MRGLRGKKNNGDSSGNPFSTSNANAAKASVSSAAVSAAAAASKASETETSSSRKSVDLGLPGETPKKFLSFSTRAPPAHIRSMLTSEHDDNYLTAMLEGLEGEEGEEEDREGEGEGEGERDERPKTSRGKSHPSPDEFFDYVVPSPEKGRARPSRILIHPSSSGEGLQRSRSVSTASTVSRSSSTRLAEENYLLGLNVDGVSRERQVSLLACWLFGSALKI